MITSASFRNFKSLRNVDIDLERLTVIVGPNASGKTSILEGLAFLSWVYSIEPKQLFVGRRSPGMLHTRGVNDEDMELQCRDTDAAIRLRVSFLSSEDLGQLSQFGDTSDYYETSPARERGLPPRLEWRALDQANGEWQEITKTHGLFFGPKQIQPIASQLSSSVLLRLDAAKLAEPSISDLVRPRVEYDGTGMASVLAFMALNQPEIFESLQGHLRTLIPTLKKIRFDRVPVNRIETNVVKIDGESLTRHLNKQHIGDEVVLDFQGASDIPAHLASEGTILVLGLLTVLFSPANPQLLLLDDLEHGLHPKAQRKLIPLLRKILEEKPDLQIVATAHSPYILNELEPQEVRVTRANENGETQCARLESHPEFERWKDEMWPGEFWSVVGEQWVGDAQGRESP